MISINGSLFYTKDEEFNIPGTFVNKKAKIGKNCRIHFPVWIADGVEIGDDCNIEAFTFIPKGVKIGNNVFVGPNVIFTNDKYPPSRGTAWLPTIVEDGVAIGAHSTILCGIVLHKGCRIGAGSVVTKDISEGRLVFGVPANDPNSWKALFALAEAS